MRRVRARIPGAPQRCSKGHVVRSRSMSRAVRLRSLVCGLASLLALIGGAASADILLVSPAIDQNDRIAAILTGASPSPRLDRVRLKGRPNRPDRWRRSIGERAPVDLTRFRLVVLENAASSGLADVEVVGGGDLLAALPGWVESGGHLLVMGGEPSFETYPGTEFASTLPVVLVPDPGTKRYHEAKRRPVEGHASDGTEVRRIHPVAKVRGDVLIRAGGEPFVVWGRTGRGEVTLVLSGVQEHHVPDAGPRESDFFASPQWERLLLERAGRALGRPLAPGSHVDPAELSPPMLRVGHAFRPDDWFGEGHEGTMVLQSPSGQAVLTVEIPTTTLPVLPETLRPGGYEALLSRAGRTRRRAVHIGTPVDLEGFDIRFFLFGHRPGPLGLAPGEAYEWAVELANIGFTSTVYASYVRRPQSNLRTMREILLGGLDLVYYQSFRDKSRYPNRWPSGVQVPQVAKDLSGEAIGWDIHSPAFRDEIDHLLDEHAEIAALPGIRALQLIEENKDGARRSPSLRKVMSDHGLSGKEKPGDAG